MKQKYIILMLILLALVSGIMIRNFVSGATINGGSNNTINDSNNTTTSTAISINYEKNDLKVVFENGTKEIGTAELKSHNKANEIKQVRVGDVLAVYYEFNFDEAYNNALNVSFIDLNKNQPVKKDYSLFYIGNYTVNGRNFPTWFPYNSKDIPKGNITIGVKFNIKPEETIDVVMEVLQQKLSKHAIVTSAATITTDGAYTIITYVNNGTFNITNTPLNAEILVVAGGGGGGADTIGAAGGGGGGGVIHNSGTILPVGNYNITIGAGGIGGGVGGVGSSYGATGGSSRFEGTNFSMAAFGGGGGGWNTQNGILGGSGGGGGGNGAVGGSGVQTSVNGTGYGNDGGDAGSSGGDCKAGGGGGAGTIGGDGNSVACGVAGSGGMGGNGTAFTIYNGTTLYYGAGGGGASDATLRGGFGGRWGGGAGGDNQSGGGDAYWYGGGGGGAVNITGALIGGNGSSGIVYVKYLTQSNYTTIDGNYTIITYVQNGTFSISSELDNVSVLIVGGGGAGGGQTSNVAGGGGAGGVIFENGLNISAGNYNITVGNGAVGTTTTGASGGNSSAFGLVAYGGGGGGANSGTAGTAGGNGGGGSGTTGGTGTQTNFSNGTALGGFSGGSSVANGAGSGGSSLSAGLNGGSQIGGNSTGSYFSSINGTNSSYACGGAGGGTNAGYSGQGLTQGCANAGGWIAGAKSNNGDNATSYGSGGGGAGYNGTAGTFIGGNGAGGVIILRYLTPSSNNDITITNTFPPNNTNFTENPIYLSAFINQTDATIVNVSLIINGTINQTNTSGLEGSYNFSISPAPGIYYFNFLAFDNYSDSYTSLNGTFKFNFSIPPPNQTATIPNFTMAYDDNLNISFNSYFSGADYVNVSFIDYDLIQTQSIVPTFLSYASNATNYFLGNYFNMFNGQTYLETNSYSDNRTIKVNATACSIGGCTNSNTFYINITDAVSTETFISKTSSFFGRILPAADSLSLFQKMGIIFIIMLLVSIATFIGLNSIETMETSSSVSIVGVINIFLIIYFILIGYLSIWLIIGLVLVILGLFYIFRVRTNG